MGSSSAQNLFFFSPPLLYAERKYGRKTSVIWRKRGREEEKEEPDSLLSLRAACLQACGEQSWDGSAVKKVNIHCTHTNKHMHALARTHRDTRKLTRCRWLIHSQTSEMMNQQKKGSCELKPSSKWQNTVAKTHTHFIQKDMYANQPPDTCTALQYQLPSDFHPAYSVALMETCLRKCQAGVAGGVSDCVCTHSGRPELLSHQGCWRMIR